MMELSDLNVFRTVVQSGGITAASVRLHRVQSNVTTRIKKLELDLGVDLFVREGRRLHLTPAGKRLVGYAEELLSLAEKAREALHDASPRGILRLGSMESTAAVRLPVPLSNFHERYPEVAVELKTGASRELTAQVLNGDLDAALVADPVSDPRLEAEAVFKESLLLVAGPKHSSIASPHDVQPRTVLAFHAGCSYRKRLEDWFTEAGVPIERVIELASYHAILGCAATGMGVALMPRSVLDTFAERSRLSVHELKPKFRRTHTLLIWRKQFPQTKIAALRASLTAQS